MLRVVQLLGWPYFKVKSSFLGSKWCNFSCFCHFLSFPAVGARKSPLRFDNGALHSF